MRKYNNSSYVHIPGVSKTRPNMALSVRQINERYVQGKSIPAAKTPIHEPKLDCGKNPMRSPYCDLVDVAEFNNTLTEALNKSESLLTEKKKEFIKAGKEVQTAYHDSIVNEAKKRLLSEQKPL